MDQHQLHDLEKAVQICKDNQYYNTGYGGDKDIRWDGAYEACKKVLDNYNAMAIQRIEEKEVRNGALIAKVAKCLPDLPHDEKLGAALSRVAPAH